MQEILDQAYDIMQKAVAKCSGKCLSLSGGLDSTILAYFLKDKGIRTISIISDDFVSSDLTYCQMVTQRFDMPLSIKMCQIDEIYSGIEETIKILGNFNDIEIRNNVVMYLAILEAKRAGFDRIITGDGADELFAGYSFLVNKDADELKADLQRIARIMHFPSQKIGKSLGVEVESPFCEKEVAEFARSLPVSLLVQEHDGKKFGKWVLRKAFEDKIPGAIAWRQKSPMQDGAGTQGLTRFFEIAIPDAAFAEKAARIKETDGVTLRSKESLQYYEIYRKNFGVPPRGQVGTTCPDCMHQIENDSKFCRMCGRFPL